MMTELTKIRSVSTDVVHIEIDEQEFARVTMLESKIPFDIEEAKKQVALVNDLFDGNKYAVLVDTRQSFSVPSNEAKKLLAAYDHKLAEAILVSSLGNRILGNIYMKFIGNRYPTKMFTSEEKAMDWLGKFKTIL